MADRIRVVLSGIGNRSLPKNPANSNWIGWVEQIRRSPHFSLVAAHDPMPDAQKRIIERGCLDATAVFDSFETMLERTPCDAIVITNPAEYHVETVRKALARNLHILIEKPFVTDLADGIALVDEAEKRQRAISVVHNWRAKDASRAMKDFIGGGGLGRLGHLMFRYVRNRENPSYPPYIFKEKHALLYAMGIHHMDLFRYLLDDEFVSVSGQSFKPPWSMYEHDTGVNLFIKTQKGRVVTYSGTISSQNSALPQESLIVEGEKGSLVVESDWNEPPVYFCEKGSKDKKDITAHVADRGVTGQYNSADAYIIENFHAVIAGKRPAHCSGRDALASIAVLDACVKAIETGQTVTIEPLDKVKA